MGQPDRNTGGQAHRPGSDSDRLCFLFCSAPQDSEFITHAHAPARHRDAAITMASRKRPARDPDEVIDNPATKRKVLKTSKTGRAVVSALTFARQQPWAAPGSGRGKCAHGQLAVCSICPASECCASWWARGRTWPSISPPATSQPYRPGPSKLERRRIWDGIKHKVIDVSGLRYSTSGR